MGGYGSGRSGWKATTENQHRIDIRWLKNNGHLCPDTSGRLSWSQDNLETGSISYRMESDRMVLNYSHKFNDGEWVPVQQTISITQTPCNYGGHRKWFLCSRCGRRVIVLYGAGMYFHCRHCYNLTYSSQQEGRSDRLIRKARKIRGRLGASNNLFEPIRSKPKYMHWKTFDRLRVEADQANNLSLMISAQRLGIQF